MLRAREVDHPDAMLVCDAQRLPGTARSSAAPVEAPVGGPAHSEADGSSKVSAKHLVPVACEQVACCTRHRIPGGVKLSSKIVCVLRRCGRHANLAVFVSPGVGLKAGPRQKELDLSVCGARATVEGLVGTGRTAGSQYPPFSGKRRGDRFDQLEHVWWRGSRADARVGSCERWVAHASRPPRLPDLLM